MKKFKTKDQIKIAAQLLFAERGIDGVSVREIVKAAGQKNMASLHYYFHSKEELARELLMDAGKLIEDQRTLLLDALEAEGGPASPTEILEIFIKCAVISNDDPRALSNVRLFVMAVQKSPSLVLETIGDTETSAYFRCLAHLRAFMTDFDEDVRERRLALLQQFVFSTLSSRERALSEQNHEVALWEGDEMLNELVISSRGLLFANPVL